MPRAAKIPKPAKRSTPKAIDDRLRALDRLERDGRPRSEPELRAIRRQAEDLRTGHRRGLVWDEAEASRAVRFFPLLRHWKGPKAGEPFVLEPWQDHGIVAPLFGWYRERPRAEGGVRRFRTAYVEIPRKNGKSFLAGGTGDKLLVADGEPGAEIYSAATKRDQAKIVWKDAGKMLGDALRRIVKSTETALEFEPLNATFQPLSKDHNSLDGLNPHGILIDELHAHKDRGLFDVLESAFGARRQPLWLSITTAGFNKAGVCFEQRSLVLRILAGAEALDSYFGWISTIDAGDDWTSPATWRKANPNLGVSLDETQLAEACAKASASPAAENNFRCKRLNQWTEQDVRWMPMELWHGCAGKASPAKMAEQLRGRKCYGSIDLASTRDLAAVALIFPPEKDREPWRVLVWFWCPREAATRRDKSDRQGYAGWLGRWITATDGSSIDQSAIRAHLWRLRKLYRLEIVGFDPWNADEFYQQLLREGWPEEALVAFPQSCSTYNEPMRRLEGLVRDGQLEHGNNPVLTWCFENLSVKTDHNGNVKPDKGKSQDKIDGACAALMALGLAISGAKAEPPRTFYESNGVESA